MNDHRPPGLEHRAATEIVEKARAAGLPIPPEVMSTICLLEHGRAPWREWLALHPGSEDEPLAYGCCEGAAVYGPDRCTCWEPVYDTGQADPRPLSSPDDLEVRAGGPCGDCAYRSDSPERTDPVTAPTLLDLPARGVPFWCHQGMRRPVAYRHPALGDVPANPDDWRPPIDKAGVPYRADGSPGLLCAGWAARAVTARRRSG